MIRAALMAAAGRVLDAIGRRREADALQARAEQAERRWRELEAELAALRRPTRGDLINARARAGAACVEGERAVAVAKGDAAREVAIGRLKAARLAEEQARAAEAAVEG